MQEHNFKETVSLCGECCGALARVEGGSNTQEHDFKRQSRHAENVAVWGQWEWMQMLVLLNGFFRSLDEGRDEFLHLSGTRHPPHLTIMAWSGLRL